MKTYKETCRYTVKFSGTVLKLLSGDQTDPPERLLGQILNQETKLFSHATYLVILTRDTSLASPGRDPVGSYFVAVVCIHSPDNINNCKSNQKRLTTVWCCCYRSIDLWFLTQVIQHYNILRSLIFNFNGETGGDQPLSICWTYDHLLLLHSRRMAPCCRKMQ